MENFNEYYEEDEYFDDLLDEYDDTVTHLIFQLSDIIDSLPDDIAETVLNLNDIIKELNYDDSDFENDDLEDKEIDDYEEETSADSVGDYKPYFFMSKRKICEETEENLKDDDEGLDEAARRVKRNKMKRLANRKKYRRNKAKIKQAQKRLRKTAKYKRYKKKAKRMAKRGKSAGGARLKKYI